MENQSGKEGENLLRIKEILFGEDLQEVDKNIKEIKTDLSKSLEELRNGIESNISEIKTKQEKDTHAIRDDYQKKLQELNSEFAEHFSSLKSLLETQNEVIDKKLDELRKAHVSKSELIGLLEEIIQKLQ